MNFLAWHNILFLSSLAVSLVIAIGAATGGLDVDMDLDADIDAPDVDGARTGLLSFLDLGQVPFTVLILVSTMVFGVVGIAGSLTSVSILGHDSPWLGIVIIAVAFVVMLLVTVRVAKFIVKHLPASETHVAQRSDLIGNEGVMLTSKFADVALDTDVHRIKCRCDNADLHAGIKVRVEDYNPETETYSVSPLLDA